MRSPRVPGRDLLPDGPYGLWEQGQFSQRMDVLVAALAAYPRVPKLTAEEARESVRWAINVGFLMARLVRRDGSVETWWRAPMGAEARDPALEVVLPEKGRLTALDSSILDTQLNLAPNLWGDLESGVPVAKVVEYFRGGHKIYFDGDGFEEWPDTEEGEEEVSVPACDPAIVRAAVIDAIQTGDVWLINLDKRLSLYREEVPEDGLEGDEDNVRLFPPPRIIPVRHLMPDYVPGAWEGEETNALALLRELSWKHRKKVPWGILREAIKYGEKRDWLVVTGERECSRERADQVRIKLPPYEVRFRREGPWSPPRRRRRRRRRRDYD